jgi:hypothetical protein
MKKAQRKQLAKICATLVQCEDDLEGISDGLEEDSEDQLAVRNLIAAIDTFLTEDAPALSGMSVSPIRTSRQR